MADECHGALDLPTESLDFTHGFSWTLQLKAFFQTRALHVRATEYLSYDSTKIASTSRNINDVRWAPSKSGNYQQEVSLVILCGQKSRIPVMFRVLPGNVPDVKTVHDL